MLAALTSERIEALLQPYVLDLDLPDGIYDQCADYLNLLLRWNARTNLTAVRDPEQLVTRQLGESLYAARLVPNVGTLLDFGSGAGFPGIPLLLARPGLAVMLAESQGKKAGFLREAIRALKLSAEVWAARVESMPPTRQFDVVTMRSVDRSESMTLLAAGRVAKNGSLLRFVARDESGNPLQGWAAAEEVAIPESHGRLQQLKPSRVFHVEHSPAE